MPSSTSSSSDTAAIGSGAIDHAQATAGRSWAKTFALAAVLIIGVVGIFEWAARNNGYVPLLEDNDRQHWSSLRDRAAGGGKDTVVLLGMSRMIGAFFS